MTFRLIARDLVRVPVRGVITDAAGKPEAFAFSLTCRRLGAAELRNVLKDTERPVAQLMADLATGWSGVTDADGNEVAFSRAAVESLLDTPGVASLAFNSYLIEQAAREKN